MIRAAQRVGLTLEEIRDALTTLPPGLQPTPQDWNQLAARLRQALAARIDHLFALLDEMTPAPTQSADDGYAETG